MTRIHLAASPIVMVLLLAACSGKESERPDGGGRGEALIPAVEVVQAQQGALPLEQRMSGTVRADNQVIIFPEVAGTIVRVAAESGDYVRQGQPLVYLRDTQYREQLQQALAALKIAEAEAKRTEATLNEARARLKRNEELAAKRYQSQQALQMVQAEVAAAEANHQSALARIAQAQATVEEQQEALRRTIIHAPISGYLGQRNAEVGMRVDAGTSLFIIGNLDQVKVKVAVSDDVIGRIEVGQTALISSPSLNGKTIRATVSRISPFLQAGSYSAEAEIDVPNPDGLLRPGMFVTVDVLYGESQQATLIPISALYEDPGTGTMGVYVAPALGSEVPIQVPETFNPDNPPPLTEPTQMTFQEVQVIARGQGVAGVAGIQPGAWVVTVGQNLIISPQVGQPQARVRAVPWQRVAELQGLQDEDLLRSFLEKQQQYARSARSEVSQSQSEQEGVGRTVKTTF